jgi:Family of unknown function (DUF6011)
MAATAVQITLSEFTAFLRPERGWSPVQVHFRCDEHVFDWVPFEEHPKMVVRVYSSISKHTNVSRQVGGDAIRVCAVDLASNRGMIAAQRVHRVENWRENLKARVLQVRDDLGARLAKFAAAKAAEPKPVAHAASSPLFAILAKAKESGIEFPKLRFEPQAGQRLVVSVAGASSKLPGTLNLTDGKPFGQNVWFGRVNLDGSVLQSKSWQPWVGEILDGFAKDPAGFAGAYGKKTGRCCFCGRHLETKESVAVGYGPICAEKFGLPWGDVPSQEVA